MNKPRIALVFIVFLSVLFFSAYADSSTYTIDDLGIQATIPSGYTVITRDTPATDPVFNRLTMTKTELDDLFITNNIYLNAVSDLYGEEIIVIFAPAMMADYHKLNDAILEWLMSESVNHYATLGIDVVTSDIYYHTQAKFLRLSWVEKATSRYGVQYYTIYNGNTYHFI